MNRRIRALSLACALSPAVGCGARQDVGPMTGAPVHGLDGTRTRVDLLARQFLPSGAQAPPGYATYCYLVFGDRANDTAAARKAAASAYLDLFSDVVDASRTTRPEHMAIILAPVRDARSASDLARKPSLEGLLVSYDYDRAGLLAAAFARAKKRLPRVSVVAYPVPLEGADAVSLEQAWVIDLTDPGRAETAFLQLRDALVVGAKDLEAPGPPRAIRILLTVFENMGLAATALPDLKT
ncbi:MAG TPA: hypothetical protein VLU43_02705 [Anaeromyxobacteraceae bacterium]|nr:hypothetical protein [Anaeromyxobacteraceae bacterium]